MPDRATVAKAFDAVVRPIVTSADWTYVGLMKRSFTQAERDDAAKSGAAMPDGSYPIENAGDLSNAIRAVGRGSGGHDAIRKHIIARAKALGKSDEIPDNWNADGSLKVATTDAEKSVGDGTLHDPETLAAIRAGLIECIETELAEWADGEPEAWDVRSLLDALCTFLDWWACEACEGETAMPSETPAPAGTDTEDDMGALAKIAGVSEDTITKAVAVDATDEDRAAAVAELRKAFGYDELLARLEEFGDKVALPEGESLADLAARLTTVEKMAAPGAPALTGPSMQASEKAEKVHALHLEIASLETTADAAAATDKAAIADRITTKRRELAELTAS